MSGRKAYLRPAVAALAGLGAGLCDLPASNPWLDRIGPVFKPAEHLDLPTRRVASGEEPRKAVEGSDAYREQFARVSR